LRIDIETGVQDMSEMDHLILEQGIVRSEQGFPVAQIDLFNPTHFVFELKVRGEVQSSASGAPTPFHFSLPSRATLSGEEKHWVRILPQTRIQLLAPLDSHLIPSEQKLLVAITNGRRALVERSFSIHVVAGDFPALEIHPSP